MLKVLRSTILDAPADRVWAVIRDFNGHDQWHPAVRRSTIERGQPADKIGCIRRFVLADGSELREQLLTLSDLEQCYSYCLLDTPIPLFNYVAHVRLLPVTDGDRTFWSWEGRFNTREGEEAQMTKLVGEQVYDAGFEAIRRHAKSCRMITVKTFVTLGEAANALYADRDACFLGGGTLVMRAVNEGDAAIATIVRSTDRGFTQVRPAGARIEIGAGVTMAQILRHDELAFLHPAARAVGGPAIRSMATVGGNLFAPSPYGDFTTALLALDAVVSVQGGYGGRETRLEEFLAGRERGPRGLVAAVALPRPAGPDVFRFRKVARVRPKGIAVLTIAAVLPLAGGRVAGARIAYGAMGPIPMRARAVERALEGRTLDPAGIAAAVAAAAEGTSPVSDAIASDWYRREILPVHLRRLLLGSAG